MTARILVTYGSRHGGTAETAMLIADTLRAQGFPVDCSRANDVSDVRPYDAVVVGGALYAFHWVREARRFVRRNLRALRERPVWMFSSGPPAPAAHADTPPVRSVGDLMRRIGARSHATFGGRLAPLAKAWALGIATMLTSSPAPPSPGGAG